MTDEKKHSPPFTIVKVRRDEKKSTYFAIPRDRNIVSFHATCPEVIGRYVAIFATHFRIPIDEAYAFADNEDGLNCITKLSWTRAGFVADTLDPSEQDKFKKGLLAV